MTDHARGRRRRSPIALLALGGLAMLGGCASAGNVPASQRGFFGGLSAAMTGADENRAQSLETNATQQEYRAGQSAERANAASRQAALTTGQVQAAQQRLASLQAKLQNQRATLSQLRAQIGQSSGSSAEAARLQQDIDRLERERQQAAKAIGGPSPATVQQLEQRSRDIDASLEQFRRM